MQVPILYIFRNLKEVATCYEVVSYPATSGVPIRRKISIKTL